LGTYSIPISTSLYFPLLSWTIDSPGAFTSVGTFSNAFPASTQGQHFLLIRQPRPNRARFRPQPKWLVPTAAFCGAGSNCEGFVPALPAAQWVTSEGN
jgi:hypothetical protein